MLLRNALLFLSRRRWLRRRMERSRVARPVVRRFVAGESLEDAAAAARRLESQGILATLDRLGENVGSGAEADASLDAGIRSIDAIRTENLQATVSIKLTQYGLDLSSADCERRVYRLAEAAKAAGTRVEIDMESSDYVDRTLGMVRSMHARHGNVRAVIQAYLYRSESDVDALCGERIPVRLCKGAYLEPPEVAYPKKADVDESYLRLARYLLRHGTEPALATHDPYMIEEARRYLEQAPGGTDGGVEFQMLYGVRRDLQRDLVAAGYRLRVYVPYGSAWYPYFMRRLAERPANVMFLLRSLIRR